MILSDFLLQQKNDNSNPHKIIPISFNMYQVLENKFYDCMVETSSRSQKQNQISFFAQAFTS